MLILTRRVGETIVIGDDVVVTVLGIKGNQVRIGINAPKDVSVHREEIYQRIQQEKNAAQQTEQISGDSQATGGESTNTPSIQTRKKREKRIDPSEDKDTET